MARTSPLRFRNPATILVLLGATAMAVLLLSAPGAAWATPFDPMGPALEEAGRIPTFMNRGVVAAEDVDGDGSEDLFYLTTDGVLQRYASDGTFLWARDYRDVNDALGIVAEEASQFFADHDWLRPQFRTAHGWAFLDTDGDGSLELVTTMAVYMLEPEPRAGSAIVTFDLTNGTVLEARFTAGIVRHVHVADFDGDGKEDLLFVREDGAIHQVGFYQRGTGSTTRVWVEEVGTQEVIWEWDSGTDWGHVHATGIGTFDGGGQDLVLTVTGPQPRFQWPEAFAVDTTQVLIALDGATGTTVWRQAVELSARQLLVGDMDGDTLDDVVLRIHEPRNATQTRGDDRAHVEARRGFDGTSLWSLQGMLGSRPEVHDLALLPGLVPRLAIGYTESSSSDLVLEQSAHLAIASGLTGTIQQDLLISSEVVPLPAIADVMFDLDVRQPTAKNQIGDVHFMHLATADVDGDGDHDLFVGSGRGTVAFTTTPGGLVTRWQDATYVDSGVLVVLEGSAGPEIWTQGWTLPPGVNVPETRYNTIPTYKHGRLFGFSGADGAPLADKILMSQVHAVARVDVDADGTPDRVIGGVSGALFAMRGNTQEVQWVADVGAAVLTIWPEDLDGDGKEDFLVEAHLRMAAVSHDGEVLWGHDVELLDPFNSGELRETEAADLNGDGVRDLVASMPTGRNNGHGTNPSKVVAVDGRTGATLWTHRVYAPLANVFDIELGDLEGDGGNDVAYGVRYPHIQYSLGALDGATGLPLWRVEEFPANVGHILHQNTMVLVESNGDAALDVVAATSNGYLRIHDGTNGATIGEVQLPPSRQEVHHLRTGAVGPAGEDGIVVFRYGGDDVGYRLGVYAPNGTARYEVLLPDVGFIMAAGVADLTGDGIDDIVAGTVYGVVVVDPSNLSNDDWFVGHIANHHVGKIALHDTDGDGTAEIDYFSSEWNWPVQRGNFIGALIGRGKEVGTVDLNGPPTDGTIPDPDPDPDPDPVPVNLPPSASYLADRTSGYPGDAFTFTSTSSDPDGNITSTVWRFGDGSTATGTTVVKTFPHDGTLSVRVQVTDDHGATDEAHGTVTVFPDRSFALSQSRDGGQGSPQEVLSYTLSLYNTGRSTDTYTITLSGPDEWSFAASGPSTVTVDGHGKHDWTIQVSLDEPLLRGSIRASVVSDGGMSASRTHSISMPLVLDAALEEGGGPYGPLDPVRGSLRLTWLDGTPLQDVVVGVRELEGGPGGTVSTDEDGRATFTVPHGEDMRMPGTYAARLDPAVSGYTTYRTLPFKVTVTG